MIGEVIGNYRILEKIGKGGMGEVFRGIDLTLEREVAIKVLRFELTHNQDLVDRFRMEAVALARLNHPNIVTLHNYFINNNQYFMVLEFIQGETLDKLIEHQTVFTWQQTISLLKEALSGLEHAHQLGVIHRDIKPANMILTTTGILKLMDFGIARILKTSRITKSGHFFGTLEYMSPEQIRGHDVDARSDVYSVGIVLYEMLTGRLPFERNTDYELIRAQIEEYPISIRTFVPQIPQKLEKIVLRALSKMPKDRFQSAVAFRDELDTVFEKNLDKNLNPKSYQIIINKRLDFIRNLFLLWIPFIKNRLIRTFFIKEFLIKDYFGIAVAFILIILSISLVGIEPWKQVLPLPLSQPQQSDQQIKPEHAEIMEVTPLRTPKADYKTTPESQVPTSIEITQPTKPFLAPIIDEYKPIPLPEKPVSTKPSQTQQPKIKNEEIDPSFSKKVSPLEKYQPPKTQTPVTPDFTNTEKGKKENNVDNNNTQTKKGSSIKSNDIERDQRIREKKISLKNNRDLGEFRKKRGNPTISDTNSSDKSKERKIKKNIPNARENATSNNTSKTVTINEPSQSSDKRSADQTFNPTTPSSPTPIPIQRKLLIGNPMP